MHVDGKVQVDLKSPETCRSSTVPIWKYLDLSSNKFSGDISGALSSCKRLNFQSTKKWRVRLEKEDEEVHVAVHVALENFDY
ncbi:hypothetical protein LXL04_016867 [Taraxacum kok-saghyz]